MNVTVKRHVHVQVVMSETFKKQYITLINQFLIPLNTTLDSYKEAKARQKGNDSFLTYIDQKINDVILKMEQFQYQIQVAKRCKIGDPFLVTQLDAYTEVKENDNLMGILGAIQIQSDGIIITNIQA